MKVGGGSCKANFPYYKHVHRFFMNESKVNERETFASSSSSVDKKSKQSQIKEMARRSTMTSA